MKARHRFLARMKQVEQLKRFERRAHPTRRTRTGASNAVEPAHPARREFVKQSAGIGAMLGLPLALVSCASDDDDEHTPPQDDSPRALFFNLSHEAHAAKTYYLTGGGRRYQLTPVSEQPHVLHLARQSNRFLSGVPDDQITHHVEEAVFATDSVTLCYVSADIDPQAGTWSMSAVQLYIPPSGAAHAYAHARKATPSGPLPLSAKRRRYGLPAAESEQDLREERALLDTTSQAATMVGGHPDLMSLEPNSAHLVHSNHVDRNLDVHLLGIKLADPQYGAATPQQTPDQPNPVGWGTLQPVVGDDGTQLRNQNGQHKGRLQYQPSIHPDLLGQVGAAMNAGILGVKDDTAVGADITGVEPNTAANSGALTGTLWMRRDGLTKVDQSSGSALGDSQAVMTLNQQNPQNGYMVSASATQNGSSIKASLTLLNWFLEFRGVYLQFLDANDNVLPLASIPEYASGGIVPEHDKSLDNDTEMFVSVVGPVFTVFAIPAAPGFLQPSFTVPASASSVRVLSSGLSFQGGNTYPETVLPGAVMTGIFNYGVTALLAAVGGGPFIPALWKAVVVPLAQTLTLELITVISASLNPNGDKSLVGQLSTPGFWISQALVLAKVLVSTAASKGLGALVAFIVATIGEATAEDAIPIAGWIMQGVSIGVGVISLAETSADLALTPWTYVDELVFTHDLSVTLQTDPNDNTFPKDANSYTVTAMFDHGTPHTKTLALPSPVPAVLPPVVFEGVPLGGKVNVVVGFVQTAIAANVADIMLGKGTTGLIPNTTETAPNLPIEELEFPIGSTTVYQHKQKTSLDANGNHVWTAAPAPTVNQATTTCAGAGTVCQLHSISVRQGTKNARGYLGYTWQGQNDDPSKAPSCVGAGVGQLDQMANLGTGPGNDAQSGYTNGACGIGVPGVKVAYNLLSHDAANFYLDTSDPNFPTVRQVTLEPTPAFSSPLSGEAWGVLNLASDALLLHPAGHLVSINYDSHKIETHRIPEAPMSDADARVQLLAQLKSGKGSRPGLLSSPVAAAIAPDGVILVLEVGNNRIQALDLGANPVPHFSKQSGPGASPYSLTLSATDPADNWQHLDMAVEYTGFIYVLSYRLDTFEYQLNIYHPSQADSKPISTTSGFNAARLTVDLWRSVYSLNYEVLQLPDGTSAGLTEPSVSLWTPCNVGQTC